MTDQALNSSKSFLRRHATFVAWAVFLALTFGFGWCKSSENVREHRAFRSWNEQNEKLTKEGLAEWRQLVAHFRTLQGQPDSQKQLEDELNDGQPFELRGEGSRKSFEWSHPKYGGRYTFEFENGVLVGVGARWGGLPEELYPRPPLTSRTNSAEALRARIATVAGYAWLFALVALIIFHKRRVLVSQVLLALALVCAMAHAVDPFYPLIEGAFSNDRLAIDVIMLLFSIVTLALTLAAEPKRHEVFRPQFGIRHAFLAVTVVACTLAAGPFGYLTLVAVVLGLALFSIVYFVNRAHRHATARWVASRGFAES